MSQAAALGDPHLLEGDDGGQHRGQQISAFRPPGAGPGVPVPAGLAAQPASVRPRSAGTQLIGECSGSDTDGVDVIPLGIIPVMAMTLRLTEEQTAKLRATAEREGVSMQAVALKAIDEYVDRRMQRRDEIIEQIFAEDAELFRRLADS